jgi:hypothetical protein
LEKGEVIMRVRNLITALGLTLTLLVALALVIGHWSVEPAAADAREQIAQASTVNGERHAALFPATSFKADDEDDEFGEDEEFEDEEFEMEDEEFELEMHRQHLEVEMAEMEANFGRLELVGRIAEVAEDELLSAAYGITHVTEFVDGGEETVDFLKGILGDTENASVKRLIRMKLAEVHLQMDQFDEAAEQLRALIINK